MNLGDFRSSDNFFDVMAGCCLFERKRDHQSPDLSSTNQVIPLAGMARKFVPIH